jgi:hypothetical protein
MTNDPIDQWLKTNIEQPEIVDAHADLSISLNKIGELFQIDTEINELDATWMTAISVSYLYHFLHNDQSQIAQLKDIYRQFRRIRDTHKLEQLLQK